MNRNIAYIYIYMYVHTCIYMYTAVTFAPFSVCNIEPPRRLLFRRLLRVPKLFVMGFNRISTWERESVRHIVLGDSQRPIHTNLFGSNSPPPGMSAWRKRRTSRYAFERFIDGYQGPSPLFAVYARLHVSMYTCAHLPHSRAVNRSIALYGIIVKSVPNLCVSRS